MFKLKILFTNNRLKEVTVKRFSDLSTHKTSLYYYEEPFDESGKGTVIPREDVTCIECVDLERGK